jgi:uncharacterized membrane-anchored protein
MKSNALLVIGFVVSFMVGHVALAASPDDGSNPTSNLHWIGDRRLTLPISSATLLIPPRWAAVIGNDARQLDASVNGFSSDSQSLEAITETLIPGKGDDLVQVDFQYEDSGYVSDVDWSDLDPDSLLQDVSNNTERHNEELRRRGLTELHVVGWLQRPAFDPRNHLASWAIENRQGDGVHNVNLTAIKLGRTGYERPVVIADLDDYKFAQHDLPIALNAFNFPTGSTYADHADGDRVAGYGIAGLVGMLVGAHLVKVGFFAGLLVALKGILAAVGAKLWAILIAPFVWLKSKFRHRRTLADV